MKILIDMNLSPTWVVRLIEAGIESVHWSSVGQSDSPDSEIFEYAREYGYILFTHDLDFGTLLAQTQAVSPSVVQIRTQDILPGRMVRRFVSVLKDHSRVLTDGALIVIDENRERVRVLPLKS